MTVILAKPGDTWYRIEDLRYAPPVDEWDNPLGVGRVDYTVRHVKVVRVTRHGVWVTPGHYREEGFINLNRNKQYAHATLEGAVESFKARKKRQVRILNYQLDQAEQALKLVERDFTTGRLNEKAKGFQLSPLIIGGF